MSVSQNIELDPNRFVGREHDLSALERCFEQRDRLVTIVGPPGTGKTRLARHFAHLFGRHTGSETFFFDLTEAASADDVNSVVARALGLSAHGETDEVNVAQLGHALASHGRALFVLDNFEHVVHEAAATLGRWLEVALEGQFLVTSRELLRVSGETAYELLPLSETNAIELFVERVRTVRSNYLASEDEQADILEIVRELDCIPLALELAATRMAVLSPAKLRSRLHERFKVLSAGPRDASTRNATLRGAIDLSWTLLTATEQTALAQCSVFRGGFDLDAAEWVLDLSGHGDDETVLDAVQALRGKSLIRSYETDELPGERRLGLYESIRDYAWEKLVEGRDHDGAIARHRSYYARFGASASGRADGPALALEYDNLVAAFNRSSDSSATDAAVAAEMIGSVLALDRVVSSRGCFATQLGMLNRCLEIEDVDPALLARTLHARGSAFKILGRMEEAMNDLERALSKPIADLRLTATILCTMGEVSQFQGQLDEAGVTLGRAALVAKESGDQRTIGRVQASLGNLHHTRGDLDSAWTFYERAVRTFGAAGDSGLAGSVLKDFGTLRLQQGRLSEARRYYAHALESCRHESDRRATGLIFGNLGILEQEVGNLDEAARCYEEALTNLRAIGDRMLEGHLLGYLGGLHRERGELPLALDCYRDAIEILRVVGDRRQQGLFLACSASIDASLGDTKAAERALVSAAEMLREVGDPALLYTLELHRAHLELQHAREAQTKGAHGESDNHLRAAVEILSGDGPDSDDVRSAHRILRVAIDSFTWGVAADGSWFRPPAGDRVSLEKRPALFPILAKLAERREAAQNDPLTIDALLEIGWPGEVVVHEAGISRVKVALTTLRKLGLRDLLVRSNGGYLLARSVAVIVER